MADNENQPARDMTKREAFAMAALMGMRAAMSPGRAEYADVARAAVNQADYLLDELEKGA